MRNSYNNSVTSCIMSVRKFSQNGPEQWILEWIWWTKSHSDVFQSSLKNGFKILNFVSVLFPLCEDRWKKYDWKPFEFYWRDGSWLISEIESLEHVRCCKNERRLASIKEKEAFVKWLKWGQSWWCVIWKKERGEWGWRLKGKE